MNPPARHPHESPPPAGKTVVGWREYVALPEWGVPAVKTKVDTGARTSALDVANITEQDGDRVQFDIVTSRTEDRARFTVVADIVRRARVKSSFGSTHDRFIVRTRIRLGTIEKDVEISLVSRKNMLCRMLLGRKALEPDLVVDPGKRYVHGRKPRKLKAAKKEPTS